MMLPVVAVTTAIARSDKLAATLRQSGCALLYIANWTTIARDDDYFQRFSGPGPLDHLWSLAVEEQFYIVWPLLVVGALALGARLGRARVILVIATLILTLGSTCLMAFLYHPHMINNTRAYEGTDTRAAALLVGALAAMILPFDRVRTIGASNGARTRVVLDLLGFAGLAGVVACVVRVDESSPFLYRGGELLLALATVALSISASHPDTFVTRLLRVAPLRWLGARSYGIYLWHLPVVAFMPTTVMADRPIVRALVQIGLILLLAAASYALVENPIRRGKTVARGVFWSMAFAPTATLALVALSLRGESLQFLEAQAQASEPTPVSSAYTAPSGATATPPTAGAALTSCREVVHVGDSTSLGLIMPQILPNPDDLIPARYHAIGVERVFPEISGARSMVETVKNQINATEVVRRRQAAGYRGCYVFALGTNDAANTSGNDAMLALRIDGIMTQIGQAPALWTMTKTLKQKGPYQNDHMKHWNQALVEACARHPNMRAYDWSSEVHDDWFQNDGIHFNTTGYKERSARITTALARAFPRAGSSSTCVIRAD